MRDTHFPLLVFVVLLVLVIICNLVVKVDGFVGDLVVVVFLLLLLRVLQVPCFRFLLRSFIRLVFRNVLFYYCFFPLLHLFLCLLLIVLYRYLVLHRLCAHLLLSFFIRYPLLCGNQFTIRQLF